MIEIIYYFLIAIVALGIGIFVGRSIFTQSQKKKEADAKSKAELIIKEAGITAENIKKDKILEAKEKFLRLKSEFEEEANKRKNQILSNENKLKQREQNMAKKI